MNADVKVKWVAELRSGKYPQSTGYLHGEGGFCCLGVLCEIAVREGVVPAPTEKRPGIFSFEDAVSSISPLVREWSGLRDALGEMVTIDDYSTMLAYHNDAGRTFAQIADAIESQL